MLKTGLKFGLCTTFTQHINVTISECLLACTKPNPKPTHVKRLIEIIHKIIVSQKCVCVCVWFERVCCVRRSCVSISREKKKKKAEESSLSRPNIATHNTKHQQQPLTRNNQPTVYVSLKPTRENRAAFSSSAGSTTQRKQQRRPHRNIAAFVAIVFITALASTAASAATAASPSHCQRLWAMVCQTSGIIF